MYHPLVNIWPPLRGGPPLKGRARALAHTRVMVQAAIQVGGHVPWTWGCWTLWQGVMIVNNNNYIIKISNEKHMQLYSSCAFPFLHVSYGTKIYADI